jgi:hypothetical protein
VELEPKGLGVPLYRRDRSGWLFAVACVAFGWLWHKPTQLPQILVSCGVGGAVFWLSIGPGLNQLKYHTSRTVRVAFFVASVVLVIAVMKHLVPLLHRYVGSL